jgi:hypothetical protein
MPHQRGSLLGSMGVPVKLVLQGETIFVCCEGCQDGATEDPAATLEKVRHLRRLHSTEGNP